MSVRWPGGLRKRVENCKRQEGGTARRVRGRARAARDAMGGGGGHVQVNPTPPHPHQPAPTYNMVYCKLHRRSSQAVVEHNGRLIVDTPRGPTPICLGIAAATPRRRVENEDRF